MNVLLRPAEPTDLAAVGALHHRSRLDAYRDFVPAEALAAAPAGAMAQWWVERWPHERASHQLTVAEHANQLAGFSYVGPDEDGVPGVGELYAIHVDPSEQGLGVGRALMANALESMRRRGWRRAVLWVLAGNAHARRFYERGGWTPDGVEGEVPIGRVLVPQLRYTRPVAPVNERRGGRADPAA